jgi:hypothetical protein
METMVEISTEDARRLESESGWVERRTLVEGILGRRLTWGKAGV